ncbi:MAG: CHAT domain-containing protein [Bradymonadia bacterium]
MAFIDTYRSNMERKRNEIAALQAKKASESKRLADLSAKIQSADSALRRTSSPSTVQSKLREISRYQKDLADVQKKIADIDKQLVAKEKEYNAEEKRVRSEEERIRKQQIREDEIRRKENDRALQQLDRAVAAQQRQQKAMQEDIDMLKSVPEKITVLFFAINPIGTDQLRLDQEARDIQEKIRMSEHRDSISFVTRWAVRPADILQAINEVNPDVVHFSGHGTSTGDLVLENTDGSPKYVTKEAMTQIITAASDRIHLLFFNACFSQAQAETVVQNVDAAIGMTTSVGDKAACVFAAQFYSSLGFGLSVQRAFSQAKSLLLVEVPDEYNTPELYVKTGIDANELIIVKPVS